MIFTDAGAAHRVQHDINQLCEAIARLLSKIHLDRALQQQTAMPRIDIEVEEGQKQKLLEGQPAPALSGQRIPLALAGQLEWLRLEGRDFAALPYRDLEPLPLSPRPHLNLNPDEAPVLIQLGDAVIERPLRLLPQAIEELPPGQIATLGQTLKYPPGTERLIDKTSARIEIEGIERFAVVDGQVQVNSLYPEVVTIQAEAIARGKENVTLEQVEDLCRYMLHYYAPEQTNGQRSLVCSGDYQAIKMTLHPKQGIILDLEEVQQQDVSAQVPTDPKADLNMVYQLLHKELERQQSLSMELLRQPEMQLRPISEVEAITGQQLGNIESLHHEVLSEAPVVLVSVDDLGRPMVTSSVVAHVEVTEDEVETEEIGRTVKSGIQEEQKIDFSALDQLQSFFDQTGAREMESSETGMVIQPQKDGLVARAPDGHVLILDGEHVQTNFTMSEIQQLGAMAQEATQSLAVNEISTSTVQQFNQEMERG